MRSFRTKTMRRCRPRHGQIAVEHLDNLEPEERNRVYQLLDLKLLAHEDGTSRSSGLSAGIFVEIKNLYLDGVLHLQHVISGFVACFPVVAAKK
jgi:hypothetical protein